VYPEGNISSLESLSSRLASLSLPDSWIIANTRPLTLYKLRVQHEPSSSARADVSYESAGAAHSDGGAGGAIAPPLVIRLG
jgi:hypothetical protein